jgi:hypothetical protein
MTSSPQDTNQSPSKLANDALSSKSASALLTDLLLLDKRYAEEIKKIQAERDRITEMLEQAFADGKIPDRNNFDGVTCYRTQGGRWTYSKAVKELQEKEKLSGQATYKENDHASWTRKYS